MTIDIAISENSRIGFWANWVNPKAPAETINGKLMQ